VAIAPSSLDRRARSLTPRGSAAALPPEPLPAGDSLLAASAADQAPPALAAQPCSTDQPCTPAEPRGSERAPSPARSGSQAHPGFPARPAATAGHRIGEVAARSGLPVKTIRFYSDEGLIVPIGRSEGRYRLYGDDVFAELSLIRTLKAMEIPLADGRRILEARRLGVCTCGDLQATIQAKVGEIQQRIVSLQQLGTELQGLLQGWRTCGGQMPLTPPGRPTAPGAQSPSRSVPRRSGPA